MYDVIVVGARCAGAPTAMLLAQNGYRVALLDQDIFPSDMHMSTHFIHPRGIAYLQRWGLLQTLQATDCPPVTRYTIDLGPVRLSGAPPSVDGNRDRVWDRAVSSSMRFSSAGPKRQGLSYAMAARSRVY